MHPGRLGVVRQRLAELYAYDLAPSGGPSGLVPDTANADEWRATAYVVVAPPDRWRIVERGHVEACDGHTAWRGTATMVTEGSAERATLRDTGVTGICLYPSQVLAELDFGAPEPSEVDGRPCWVAHARPRRPDGPMPPPDPALSGGRRLGAFVGVDHRFWFDVETGIVLRHEGSIDGVPCSTILLSDLVFDRPLGSVEFGPPPGAAIRPSHELLRDHLAEMGIDPDQVDLDDPEEVRRALRGA
jgi:hypothetical protein